MRSRFTGGARRWTLLVALAGVATALLLPASGGAGVAGAAFTTDNPNAGSECLHGRSSGDPAVNCNQYGAKDDVWINGGPSGGQNKLTDGSYFFAVLVPGGQPDPNDGGAKNLSDESSAGGVDDECGSPYTDRTFTVSSGKISAFTGPGAKCSYATDAAYASPLGLLVNLFPYDTTSNPGGVYILAVCSLGRGYPASPRDCKYDAFKVRQTSTPSADAPTVTKTAAGTYDTTFAWQIAKAVDKTSVVLPGSGLATFTYTVTVTHDAGTQGGVSVGGTITVFNPNDDEVTGATVSDSLSDGTTCAVTGGANATLAPGNTTFAYSCALSSVPSSAVANTAVVSWPQQTLSPGGELAAGSADFTFPAIAFGESDRIDECVDVTDTFNGGSAGPLGRVCVGDGGTNPRQFSYQRQVGAPLGQCVRYDNTATFTTTDSGATGSDGKSVTVCNYNNALTPGYWRNHLAPIGSNLPGYSTSCKSSQGCSSSGPYTITFLAQSLGGYTVDTISKVVAVFDKMNCNNLSTANNALGCLAGHLLAAKLNVANSSNPCINATIAAADAFLAARSYAGPSGTYTLTAAQRAQAISLKSQLDRYNNGGGC